MTTFKYDPNNTEGAYPTAMVVEGAELKKGNKIVATDLIDLYDTDINNPQDKQALTYVGDKWINGEVTGSSCNVFLGFDETPNGYTTNSIFVDANTINQGTGQLLTPFISIDDAITWLRNKCVVIPDDILLTIHLLSNTSLSSETSLNHQYGYNIVIDGGGYNITNNSNISIDSIDKITILDNIYNFSGGGSHTFAIRSDGTLWGTGGNFYGQLGLGDNIDRSVFTQSGVDTDWVKVSCGKYYTLAIKKDGTLWSTGNNVYGQLGLGDNTNRDTFTQVGTDNDWVEIYCYSLQSLAIKSDGTLWGTGYNYYGQLGLGDNTNRNIFTQSGVDTDWNKISIGFNHALAIKSDGTLWSTGNNYYGQLGLGDNIDRNVFTQIGTDTDWVGVACGVSYTLAIKSTGTLWSTGNNYYGQLGLGDNTNRNIFTQTGTDTDWVDVACGDHHTLAIKSTGTLWSTGINFYGQLGLGDNIDRNVFTQIGTDTDWVGVACGEDHSIAVKYNTILWATGNNNGVILGINSSATSIYRMHVTYIKLFTINNIHNADPILSLTNKSISLKNITFKFDLTYDSIPYKYNNNYLYTGLESDINMEYHTSQVYNDKLYLIYGNSTGNYVKISIYNFIDNTWEYDEFSGIDLYQNSSCIINNKIYIQAGTSIYVYDCNIRTLEYFTYITGTRKKSSMVSYNGKLYVYGGYYTTNILNFRNDLIEIDVYTKDHNYKTSAPSIFKGGGSTANVYGDFIYFLGGNAGLDNSNANPYFYKYDIINNTWIQLDDYNEGEITQHTSNIYEDKLFVFGGVNDQSVVPTSYYYDLRSNQWVFINTPYNGDGIRKYHTMSLYKDKMYIHGGRTSSSSVLPTSFINIYEWTMFIDNKPLSEYSVNKEEINIYHTDVVKLSTLKSNNNTNINEKEEILQINDYNDQYLVINLNKVPINYISSVGIFNGIIPDNIYVDVESTIEIQNLSYNINNWKIKNNSSVIIDDNEEIYKNINIDNENSTIILNNAII